MTHRGAITTYKAKERSNNRDVIIKVICPAERNVVFGSILNRMDECDSRYIIRYNEWYENKIEYLVGNGDVL